MGVSKGQLQKNLATIRERIAAACDKASRSPEKVTVVAVTKTADLDTVKSLVEIGLTDIGESRAQQLNERVEELSAWLQRRRTEASVRWHMIGHLQRNKVRHVLGAADVIHSVDSLRLAEEINSRAEKDDRTVDVLLQVNCAEEPQKSGCAVGAATHLAELICTLKRLRLIGLMAMAPLSDEPEDARFAFARLRELFEEMRSEKIGGEAFVHLSMGMSQDYAVAVEEGATMLRIGTAIFEGT